MDIEWDKTCRTCLRTNNSLESIYSSPDPLALEYEYSASYSRMIKSVTSVSIVPNDKLPQKICQKCINGLLIAFNFQKITIKTKDILQSLCIPEIKILPDSSLNHDDMDVVIKEEILTPEYNESYLFSVSSKCDKVPEQLMDSTLTNDIEKIKQNILTNSVKSNEYNLRSGKITSKLKTCEIPKKQPLLKVKCLQSLQNQNQTKTQTIQSKNNALNGNQVFVPWVSPPPLVYLSESKTTPPPLVFLPNKPIDNCKYCEMKFTTEFDLKVHLLTHEIDSNSVNSNNCHFCWETPKDLVRHLTEHYKFLVCAQCNIKCISISEFENHMKDHPIKIVTQKPNFKTFFKCRICGIVLSRYDDNICHFCKSQKIYLCRFCGKEILDLYLFIEHERKH